MFLLLLFVAALLYYPALRHVLGWYLLGVLFMVIMAATLGTVGVWIALALGVVVFVRGFWRPANGRRRA